MYEKLELVKILIELLTKILFFLPLMATEVVNLTISTTEVQSISDVASIMAEKIQEFAEKYGVGSQHDKQQSEEDFVYFLAKRGILNLETIEVHILEDGQIGVGSFTGRRVATLRFNIRYVGRGYRP
jgi:hypothetical protein